MRGAVVGALLGLLLWGCSGPAPVDHHYRLEAGPPSRRFATPIFYGTLQVRRPRTDSLTGSRNLVYRNGDGAKRFQLRRYAYERWVDPPPNMIEHEIARFLRRANVADIVVDSDLRVHPDLVLTSRLLRLERVEAPSAVVVGLEVSVTRSADLALLLQETYLVEDRSAFADVAATVAAYNRVLTEILERLVGGLEQAEDGR